MNTKRTHNQINSDLLHAYKLIAEFNRSENPQENMLISEILYEPSEKLKEVIDKYNKWKITSPDKIKNYYIEGGNIMEQIAYLVFKSLNCDIKLESFTSYDSQLDLVVSGTEIGTWETFSKLIGLKDLHIIIVEAKNRKEQIDSQVFSRLCYILQNKYVDQGRLGIFFSQTGAKGFPANGTAQKHLSYARATQIIFHARTEKYVVVFDDTDIQKLTEAGAFIVLLKEKIQDVEHVIGQYDRLDAVDGKSFSDIQSRLPPHLAEMNANE